MRTHASGNDVDLSHPKLAAAEAWVSQRLGGSGHERRVASVAATLFDLAAPLHGLTSLADRRLLQLAALVHDVGRCAGKPGHPAAGAAMVLSDEAALPLTAAERRAVAYLTLHHRGPVPEIGDDRLGFVEPLVERQIVFGGAAPPFHRRQRMMIAMAHHRPPQNS